MFEGTSVLLVFAVILALGGAGGYLASRLRLPVHLLIASIATSSSPISIIHIIIDSEEVSTFNYFLEA